MFFVRIAEWLRSLNPDVLWRTARIALYVAGGFILLRLLAFALRRTVLKKSSAQGRMVAQKVVGYAGTAVILLAVLNELGVQITALLGAAGILGIAIGFASQTSFSNIISGIFLISEKPFAAGDVITVGGTTGVIQSIDLLSIKIRTFDNLFVRIPNEKILSSEVTNITRFPIRRMDIMLQVAYKEDLPRVKAVLLDLARANPYCLDEPEPIVLFTDLKDSGIDILYGLWFPKEHYLNLRNSIIADVLRRFREEGIEIPFPHRTLYAGSATAPLPVRIVEGDAPPEPGLKRLEPA